MALSTFIVEARQALSAIEMEGRRALDYIAHDQAKHWQAEIRRGSDSVQRAKIDIHNALAFKRIGEHRPSCVEEKKALKQAELRLKLAQAKAEAVRHWTRVASEQFRDFQVKLAQFISTLDGDLPKAIATLERITASLERYLGAAAPQIARQAEAAWEQEQEQRQAAVSSIEPQDEPAAETEDASDHHSEPHALHTLALQKEKNTDEHEPKQTYRR